MKVTKKDIRANWRDPKWNFHNETTFWYDIVGNLSCICYQNCNIEFSEKSGIGYDVAIPNSYHMRITVRDDYPCKYADADFTVASHADLKKQAVDWIYDTVNNDNMKQALAWY